jgi:hypothetical protein
MLDGRGVGNVFTPVQDVVIFVMRWAQWLLRLFALSLRAILEPWALSQCI